MRLSVVNYKYVIAPVNANSWLMYCTKCTKWRHNGQVVSVRQFSSSFVHPVCVPPLFVSLFVCPHISSSKLFNEFTWKVLLLKSVRRFWFRFVLPQYNLNLTWRSTWISPIFSQMAHRGKHWRVPHNICLVKTYKYIWNRFRYGVHLTKTGIT
jgi:hypothetical protein